MAQHIEAANGSLLPRRPGPLGRFFVYCSGADPATLANCPQVERTRYAGLGGLVLSTALMAGIAMATATTLAFRLPVEFAIAAGAIWALIIFNLDRWLVSSYRPQTSRLGQLAAIGPRVLLSLVLGLTISEPLVLMIFDPEVRAHAATDRAAAVDAVMKSSVVAVPQRQIDELERRIAAIRAESTGKNPTTELAERTRQLQDNLAQLEKNRSELVAAQAASRKEGDGTGGTKVAGEGPVFRQREREFSRLENQRAELERKRKSLEAAIARLQRDADARINDLTAQVAAKRDRLDAMVDEQVKAIDRSDGLIARINALAALGDTHAAVRFAHIVLTLLILLIDLLPITGKVLMSSGGRSTYDNLLAAREIEIAENAKQRVISAREHTSLSTMEAGERRRYARDIARIRLSDQRYEEQQVSRRRRRELDEEIGADEPGEWNGRLR